jgi:hypothetical protein
VCNPQHKLDNRNVVVHIQVAIIYIWTFYCRKKRGHDCTQLRKKPNVKRKENTNSLKNIFLNIHERMSHEHKKVL